MPGSRLREGVIRRESHFATSHCGNFPVSGLVEKESGQQAGGLHVLGKRRHGEFYPEGLTLR